jgi:hypothetical protein
VNGSFLRPPRGCPGRSQSTSGNERSEDANPKRNVSGLLGGVRGLPLGAKIAGTINVAFAWFLLLAGFLKLLPGSSYLLSGSGGWVASGLFWWGNQCECSHFKKRHYSREPLPHGRDVSPTIQWSQNGLAEKVRPPSQGNVGG